MPEKIDEMAVANVGPTPGLRATAHRIVDIEALRTIAIVFVMVEHIDNNLLFWPYKLQWFLSWGQLWPGVDLFFVISGFLVTGDLLRRLDGQRGLAQVRRVAMRFWLKRAWRLWPTAWLWLALIVVGSAFMPHLQFLGPLNANLKGALAGVLFYANLRSVNVIWEPYGASFPYWSLSLEEQFYILLPLVMVVLGRFLPAVVALCIAVQFPLAHERFYFFFRSDALLWGVLLAAWHGRQSYARFEPRWLASRTLASGVMFCALTALFLLAGRGNTSPPFVVGLIALIAAGLVWVATYDRDVWCPVWARGFVLWTGSRSYALYVAHIPVYNCSAAFAHYVFTPGFHPFTGAGNPYAMAVVVPLMAGAAEVTHRFVEQPLRRLGARLADRDFAMAARSSS